MGADGSAVNSRAQLGTEISPALSRGVTALSMEMALGERTPIRKST